MEPETIFHDKTKILTITEIADKISVHPQTVRNWEELGIITPQRLVGGRRVYGAREFKQIEKIIFFKNLGMNISAIKYVMTTYEC